MKLTKIYSRVSNFLSDREYIEKSLLKQIEANPKDLDSYLVLADFYEENGEDEKADRYRNIVNYYRDRLLIKEEFDRYKGVVYRDWETR